MSNQLEYIVQPGDTFTSIVNNINQAPKLTVEAIEKANPEVKPTNLQVGQTISIPMSGEPILHPTAETKGYWFPEAAAAPQNATLSAALYGWDPDKDLELATQNSALTQMIGEKYLCFGGGGSSGEFNPQVIDDINRLISSSQLQGFDGIGYDVECGTDGLLSAFLSSFQLAKQNGFKVLVTVSHSAPYGIGDGDELMNRFFADSNIDILSPQLYSNGDTLELATTSGKSTTWADYSKAKASIVPSIPYASDYETVVTNFDKLGITLSGYILWK